MTSCEGASHPASLRSGSQKLNLTFHAALLSQQSSVGKDEPASSACSPSRPSIFLDGMTGSSEGMADQALVDLLRVQSPQLAFHLARQNNRL
jgi:hypothetical protein